MIVEYYMRNIEQEYKANIDKFYGRMLKIIALGSGVANLCWQVFITIEFLAEDYKPQNT